MFFILSKIFWVLAKPLNCLAFMMVLGLLLRLKWRRAGGFILTTACLLFLLLGLFPVGPNMMVYLERQYQRPQTLPEQIDGFIVLGGAFHGYLSHVHGYPVAAPTAERIHDFIRLGREYPQAKLVFSGGSGDPVHQQYIEAPVIEDFFEDMNAPRSNLILESASRNTYQNARYSYDLVKPEAGQTWVLITSAYHMPRAMAVFSALDWNVIPYPTDHNTTLKYHVLSSRKINVARNFDMLETGLKEWIGTAIYYLTGKSALPFPAKIVPSDTQNG